VKGGGWLKPDCLEFGSDLETGELYQKGKASSSIYRRIFLENRTLHLSMGERGLAGQRGRRKNNLSLRRKRLVQVQSKNRKGVSSWVPRGREEEGDGRKLSYTEEDVMRLKG